MLSLTPRIGWITFLSALTALQAAPQPVTDKPVNLAAGVFHFAVLPDRTGGNRPDVYESALAKLNLLQPAFVMCTGDLIDGYTLDPQVVAAQWNEFDALVNRLQMPFHYVAGNHDISNPLMFDAWVARHGSPWSSFVYQDVLFISLHTEDRPFGGLGDEQLAWVQQTLAANAGVRWTMLFMHRPLWREKNQGGFEQVRALLKGRKFTVFASHYHNYLKSSVDGMDAYIVATAGGSSLVRGPDVGEFDHLTWVTMKPDGPVVANLALSGIFSGEVVTEETHARVAALRDGGWLHVRPVVHTAPDFQRLTVPVELRNPTDQPLRVSGTLAPAAGIRFEPAQIEREVSPHQNATIPVDLIATGSAVSIHAFNEARVRLTLTGAYEIAGKQVSLPTTQPVRLDWKHAVPHAPKPIVIDGQLDEWPAALFTTVEHPMAIKEDWDWHGPADGRFRYAVQQREGRFFMAVETFDDHVIGSPDPQVLQDKLMFLVRSPAGMILATGFAGTQGLSFVDEIGGAVSWEISVRATPTGLTGEFSYAPAAGEKSVHVNFGWQDHDRPENTKPSVLWWRDESVREFGEFVLR